MSFGEAHAAGGPVDTHVHVFDPVRFPYAASAAYQPAAHETATARHLAALLSAHGMGGVVVVDPTSGYDGDSRCLLDALDTLGPVARGVVRWAPRGAPMRRHELARLRARGVAGVRVDCVADGVDCLGTPGFDALVRSLADLDLVLDVQCERSQLRIAAPALARAPTRNVVDHMGRPDLALGAGDAGFRALLDLVAQGRTCVKLSAPMRMSQAPGWIDVDPFVRALYDVRGPDALVWGSDWPFLRAESRTDYAPLLALLARWIPDAEDRRRVLVDTPRTLFFG
ncbi:MAG: amidohydrolase family protein [Burkholderiales bacterium]